MASKIHKFAMVFAMYAIMVAGVYAAISFAAWEWLPVEAITLRITLLCVLVLTLITHIHSH